MTRAHDLQWFEVLDGLLGPRWKALGLAFNCTFLLFGSVIQLIACARYVMQSSETLNSCSWSVAAIDCAELNTSSNMIDVFPVLILCRKWP